MRLSSSGCVHLAVRVTVAVGFLQSDRYMSAITKGSASIFDVHKVYSLVHA